MSERRALGRRNGRPRDGRTRGLRVGLAPTALALAVAGGLAAQEPPADEHESVGRGWPVLVENAQFVGATAPFFYLDVAAAKGGDAPAGVEPLQRDIFTTDDFYADRALWSDPRYYRCNSPIALDAQWGDYSSAPRMIENDDPTTGAWGHCDRDYPRASIVSPYPFRTAQEHYAALLAEAEAKGGPTRHARAALPDWNGRYTRPLDLVFGPLSAGEAAPDLPDSHHEPPQWVVGGVVQTATTVSLLTPDYQERLVQQLHHQVRDHAAQWSLMYCRPEGFMRWWSGPGGPGALDVTVVPDRVQFMGGPDNAFRNIHIGREFTKGGRVPRLGEDVPQWLGESVGFWDGEALITWTSNIQGWFTHASWEHSSALQTVEIWTPRRDDASGLIGLEHETVFYDPEAFVQPVREVRFFARQGGFNDAPPVNWSHCNQTIFLDEDGRGASVNPGQTIPYTVEDLYDRPWARVWERYFESGLDKPPEEDLFTFE